MRHSIFKDLPIKHKLVMLIIGISGVSLFLFTLLSVFTQVKAMRQTMIETKSILSESIADLSTAALSFADHASAKEILETLHADPDIELAVIYTKDEAVFASYLNPDVAVAGKIPDKIIADKREFGFQDNKYKLEIFQPVVLEDNQLGTLYVLSNTDRMTESVEQSALLLLASMLVLLGVTFIASTRLQKLITRPVSLLAETAREISDKGDYSVRVERKSNDEVGQLIEEFNAMLTAIQDRDEELQQHRQNLEELVKQRTTELRAKRDEALAAARAKSEFLANMSHEIRTPMNGVIGVLSLLRDAPLTEEFKRLLDTATRSADSLLLIINDILDFSKIDAGKITFESIVFDLRAVVEETSELFIDTINLKHIDLTCYIPIDIPCRVKGDPTRLRQIITNLVSNAVKFTDHGEVKLQVSMVSHEGMRQELLFTVEDTGIGIPEDSISRLFDKFTQADGSTTRKYGGTGLGLSVCKQLVEKQGGSIGLNSRLGFGATFWFTLPFEIVEETCPLIPYKKLAGKQYIVVDDNHTNCKIVTDYLNYCDAQVTSCSDGESCLVKLTEMQKRGEGADTLLIDFGLPQMNGLQLAERIRKQLGDQAPEMVLLGTGTFSRAQMQKAGIRALLLKPVRQLELYNVLADVPVQERQHMPEVVDQERTQSPVLHGTVLLVDDEPINQKIALAILSKYGLEADVASNGYEAVTMTEKKRYSVVLMDIQMPEMSGYEATEIIRTREKQHNYVGCVIIAMTANAMESTRKRCFEVGMNDFFTKPIKPDILAERLQPWLKKDEEGTPVESIPVEKRVDPVGNESVETWNLETAMGFVGGDEELFRELVTLFLGRNDLLLANLESAIVSGKAVAVRDAAHAYKGAVSHFAANVVRDLVFKLEMKGKEDNLEGSEALYIDLCVAAALLLKDLKKYLNT